MEFDKIISITEARRKIFELVSELQGSGTFYTLTEHGKAKAVLTSVEYFNSLCQTAQVLNSNPEIAEDISSAEDQYKLSKYIELSQLIEKEGFIVSDNKKNIYEAKGPDHGKGSKNA